MAKHPQRSLLILVCSLVLVCVLLDLLVPGPVKADVGVMPILPGGSNLKPDKQTPIQMAAEVITMNVRPATEADNAAITLNPEAYGYEFQGKQFQPVWFQAVAEVQADFTMKNPTSEPVSMTVWFPLASVLESVAWDELNPDEIVPSIASFQVAVNGDPLDYAVSELPNPKGEDQPPLPWASFPVTFPAGMETMIYVSYVLPLPQLPKSHALALYYIFQTGAGWSGPIGQAELILNLPYPASTETLAGMPSGGLKPPYFVTRADNDRGIPPGGVLEGNQARWTWKNLEPGPKDDFSILLIEPGSWEALQADREAVKTRPDDGQAWFKLCTTYYYRSHQWQGVKLPANRETYQPLGVEACQEAARLLPLDAAPHYVLAGFYLSELSKNPSYKMLQPVLIELKLGQALEAVQPPSEVYLCDFWEDSSNAECLEAYSANAFQRTPNPTWYASISEYIAETAESIFINATATAEWATQDAKARATLTPRPSATASPTRKATLTSSPSATLTPSPSSTPIPLPTSTLTPLPSSTRIPSTTSQPPPTILPTTAETASRGQGLGLFVAAGVIGLVIVGYLVGILLRRSRK